MATVQKIPCGVEQITDHGGRVYTLLLHPERRVPLFLPGQFLHLALGEYGPSSFWPDSRPFYIASSPAAREMLRLSYSVQGRFTARMEAEITPGTHVWVKMPYGEFAVEPGRDAVLLAGGTGITAFSAFLEGLTGEHAAKVLLYYGARTPDLLIYRDLVNAARRVCPNLSVRYFAEEGASGEDSVQAGRIALDSMWAAVKRLDNPAFYLAGPPAMHKAFSGSLAERGIAHENIRVDAWE
jgi:NAD(P)H-flavin reductase